MARTNADPAFTYASPPRMGPRGYLLEARGLDAALACVDVILSTRRGEVPQEPEFGSRLPDLAWEPNDAALASEMRREAAESVARWEPRLAVERAEVRQEAHRTEVNVTLRVRGTDRRVTRSVAFERP